MNSMKRNGYLESPILDTRPGVCFLCGKGGACAVHEVFYGTANRKISKEQGFYVWLCPPCHRNIHEKYDDGEADEKLKRECFKKFCETHSREDFYKLIGKYYD